MRDENGNINPTQIRQNVIDAHENVNRANEAVNNGVKVVTREVSEAVTEIAAPKPVPANVTQPER